VPVEQKIELLSLVRMDQKG